MLLVPVLSYHLLAHDLIILLLPVVLNLEVGGAGIAQFCGAWFCLFPPLAYLSVLPSPVLLWSITRRTPIPHGELVPQYAQLQSNPGTGVIH